MSCYFIVLFSFNSGGRTSHPPYVLFYLINIFMRGFLSKKIKKRSTSLLCISSAFRLALALLPQVVVYIINIVITFVM